MRFPASVWFILLDPSAVLRTPASVELPSQSHLAFRRSFKGWNIERTFLYGCDCKWNSTGMPFQLADRWWTTLKTLFSNKSAFEAITQNTFHKQTPAKASRTFLCATGALVEKETKSVLHTDLMVLFPFQFSSVQFSSVQFEFVHSSRVTLVNRLGLGVGKFLF